MKIISNTAFGGERPLFESHDLRMENVVIRAGESAIKECSNIEAVDCRFEGNYPFWHVHGFVIDRCFFDVGGRSALWYSDHLKMTDTRIDAPKMFREMHDIEIENVEINDANEVFWRCKNLNIKNLKFQIFDIQIFTTPEHLIGIVYLYILYFDVVHLAKHFGCIDTRISHFQMVGIPQCRTPADIEKTTVDNKSVNMPEGIISFEPTINSFDVAAFLDG